MKGVILCGGKGTRLYPLTHVTNKHLLPVYNKPMVYYPIETLIKAGIEEVLIVVGGPYAGHFLRVLKNGEEFGLKSLSYAYQDGSGGIAEALALAEDFADGEGICVILGDNTTDADISQAVEDFDGGAHVFLKEVTDPERFGVPTIEGNDIIHIEEKPSLPASNYAVTGLYLYDNDCFDFISVLEKSDRGELEVTDLNNAYINRGKLKYSILNGFWTDAGKFETLFKASENWSKK